MCLRNIWMVPLLSHNHNQKYLYHKNYFSLLFFGWVFFLEWLQAARLQFFIHPTFRKSKTRQYFIILSTRCTSKGSGSFKNYVDQILHNFDHLPQWSESVLSKPQFSSNCHTLTKCLKCLCTLYIKNSNLQSFILHRYFLPFVHETTKHGLSTDPLLK